MLLPVVRATLQNDVREQQHALPFENFRRAATALKRARVPHTSQHREGVPGYRMSALWKDGVRLSRRVGHISPPLHVHGRPVPAATAELPLQ